MEIFDKTSSKVFNARLLAKRSETGSVGNEYCNYPKRIRTLDYIDQVKENLEQSQTSSQQQ